MKLRRQIADVILEVCAEESEWWVADLELGGIEFYGDHKHLKRRAAELRAQKAKL